MSIEKNLQTMADNSERIAAALEGLLVVFKNESARVTAVNTDTAANTTGAESSGVTSTKDSAAETAAKEELAKAEKAKKAAAAKAAKEEAEKAKAEAEKAKSGGGGEAVSYDSIKAVVTELAGKGPDGITAIKGVLKNYGAAKASDVPEDKWGELLTKFEQAKTELEGGDGDFA